MKRMYKSEFIYKTFKYGIVGVLGTLMHFGILVLFVEIVKLDPVISSSIGFTVVLLISYFLNKKWTFKAKAGGYVQFFKYVVVSMTGLVLNTTIMYITVNVLSWYYICGQVCVVIFVPLTNFILNNYWTFNNCEI